MAPDLNLQQKSLTQILPKILAEDGLFEVHQHFFDDLKLIVLTQKLLIKYLSF